MRGKIKLVVSTAFSYVDKIYTMAAINSQGHNSSPTIERKPIS